VSTEGFPGAGSRFTVPRTLPAATAATAAPAAPAATTATFARPREPALSPAVEIHLLVARELRKSFRSVKGILLALLSILGGGGVAMAFAWVDRVKRENLPPGVNADELQQQLFNKLFEPIYGAETGHFLSSCPYTLWLMLMITIWLGPMLVALMGFDSISGEMQHRSVRFWTVRARRSSYRLGKFLGAWIVVLAVTLGMNVIVWAATATVGGLPLATVLGWGVRFFLVSVPISAAWCGIATLAGSQFKTPMLSLLVILATFFVLWMVRIVAGVADVHWLALAYPNIYDEYLLSPNAAQFGKGLLGTGLIAVLTTTAATLSFARRDI
jgi:ABC-type transport system involved in multi-copper enzyme maturation permease subunit